jgi:predicted dehydrogenase/threonine dehydrogenase-like Zn-dependent dehydrogenase|tara:strand:+ start:6026 stop:8152 length:2127 start_codon:yes stop_codon:yes gene_type:complete
MKQIVQNLSNGETSIVDIPPPKNIKNHLIVSSKYSLVSTGTERMLINFGRSNLLQKAISESDRVLQVFDKIKTDGILPTYEAVKSKLNDPIALGYSNAGVVLESSVQKFKEGDRVISNGPHAEILRVPSNLCALIPEKVTFEEASFTVIGSVSLQGIRLAKPNIGETFLVIGLGLLGLITTQILIANGCDVIGVDHDEKRCQLAKSFGAKIICLKNNEDFYQSVISFNKGKEVDGTIICADTKSNSVIHNSAQSTRQRGRIILVGQVGLNLKRDDFYKKEISFQVSSSYGPGRYDKVYEEGGVDYPIGFVRWTAQRNFETFLNLLSEEKINMKPLVSQIFDVDNSLKAYETIEDKKNLATLIKYSKNEEIHNKKTDFIYEDVQTKDEVEIEIGLVGPGNFSMRTLLPAIKKQKYKYSFASILSSQGLNAHNQAKKFKFKDITTDEKSFWENKNINTVFITTPHNFHSDQVCEGIKNNKNIFVEKPLAINLKQLEEVKTCMDERGKSSQILMIGFNRRFAPLSKKIKKLLEQNKDPKTFIMTINAGFIEKENWQQDLEVGGGRIIGEACHFIDLMRFFAGSEIESHSVNFGQTKPDKFTQLDQVLINMNFKDGSMGAINYLSNGGKSFPKERIDIFSSQSCLQLNNFRNLKGYNWPNFKFARNLFQNKGHDQCVESFFRAITNGEPSPIPFEEIFEVSKVAIEITESFK